MFKLPLYQSPDGKTRPTQSYSPRTLDKHARVRGAVKVDSICPYCAVGCATHVYTKSGQVIDIEGSPKSPINEGTLCPKGANSFQLHHNEHREKKVLYRAPYSDKWETKPLDWAMETVAQRLKEARDRGYKEKNEEGQYLNAVENVGSLGGATIDNEENYLIKKLLGAGLGIVSIENQARI